MMRQRVHNSNHNKDQYHQQQPGGGSSSSHYYGGYSSPTLGSASAGGYNNNNNNMMAAQQPTGSHGVPPPPPPPPYNGGYGSPTTTTTTTSTSSTGGYGGYGGYTSTASTIPSYGGYHGSSSSSSSANVISPESKYEKKKRRQDGGGLWNAVVSNLFPSGSNKSRHHHHHYGLDDDDYKYGKSSAKNSTSSSNSKTMLLVMTCVLGVWSLGMVSLWWKARGQYQSLLKTLQVKSGPEALKEWKELSQEYLDTQENISGLDKEIGDKFRDQLDKLRAQNQQLQKERDEYRVKYEQLPEDNDETSEEDAKYYQDEDYQQIREQAFQNQILILQQATRKESKRTVLERFGPPPHRVSMTVAMGEEHGYEETFEYEVIIEMAPLDLVPHAVHLFMEQVDHGLWNHSYFYLNGPHVMQAGPPLEDDESDDDDEADPLSKEQQAKIQARQQAFRDLGLDQLAFPDYSDDYPHLTWTLGYTGRPGGPDWYINKVDNTETHGPGGQSHHALEEQGDSCFAKIVKGQEYLTQLYSVPIYADGSDWHWFFQEPIEITKAYVIPPGVDPWDDNVNVEQASSAQKMALAASAAAKSRQQQQQQIDEHNRNHHHHHKPKLPHLDHAVAP